jgi:uncharacterized protein
MELVLQISQRCNLACDYCYADTSDVSVMSVETAMKAVDQFMPDKGPLAFSFFGGEPLLVFDRLREIYEQVLARVAERPKVKLSCTLTTNGAGFTSEVADWFQANGMEMGLSLDGTAAMHNTHRKTVDGRGSHAAARAAWDLAIEREIPIMPNMVVTPATAGMLAESVRYFIDELSVHSFSISPDLTASWDDAAQATMHQQYAAAVEMVKKAYLAGHGVKITSLDEKIRTQNLLGKQPAMRCKWGRGKVSVAVDGGIFPCEIVGSSMPGVLGIGHVGSALNEAHISSMKTTLARSDAMCDDCPELGRCHFWCGCQRFLAGQSLATIPPALCFFQKLTGELADGLSRDLLAAKCKAYYAEYCVPKWIRRAIRWIRRR